MKRLIPAPRPPPAAPLHHSRPTVVDPSGDTIRQLSVSPPLEPPSVLADPPIPSPGLPTEEEEEEDPEEEVHPVLSMPREALFLVEGRPALFLVEGRPSADPMGRFLPLPGWGCSPESRSSPCCRRTAPSLVRRVWWISGTWRCCPRRTSTSACTLSSRKSPMEGFALSMCNRVSQNHQFGFENKSQELSPES